MASMARAPNLLGSMSSSTSWISRCHISQRHCLQPPSPALRWRIPRHRLQRSWRICRTWTSDVGFVAAQLMPFTLRRDACCDVFLPNCHGHLARAVEMLSNMGHHNSKRLKITQTEPIRNRLRTPEIESKTCGWIRSSRVGSIFPVHR